MEVYLLTNSQFVFFKSSFNLCSTFPSSVSYLSAVLFFETYFVNRWIIGVQTSFK